MLVNNDYQNLILARISVCDGQTDRQMDILGHHSPHYA